MLYHTELQIESGHEVDKEILELVADCGISVMDFDKEFMRNVTGSETMVKPFFIKPAYPALHSERQLISLDEMHEIRLHKQHLIFGETLLHKRHAAIGRYHVGYKSGAFCDVVQLGAGVRIKDIRHNAVGFYAGVELDGLERAVYILKRQSDDIIGKLSYAVLMEPV